MDDTTDITYPPEIHDVIARGHCPINDGPDRWTCPCSATVIANGIVRPYGSATAETRCPLATP